MIAISYFTFEISTKRLIEFSIILTLFDRWLLKLTYGFAIGTSIFQSLLATIFKLCLCIFFLSYVSSSWYMYLLPDIYFRLYIFFFTYIFLHILSSCLYIFLFIYISSSCWRLFSHFVWDLLGSRCYSIIFLIQAILTSCSSPILLI